MGFNPSDVDHLCRLARLAPSGAARETLAAQCSDILTYMDALSQVDTTGVDPLYSPVSHGGALREDAAARRRTREEILANAPESDGAFFVVPRIVEGK